ncbi:MAG: protoporphyrinogen oxidase [Mangrovibacterium sp.]
MSKKIAIIGGGLTGLSIGHQLKKAGVSFTIFERCNRVGGAIRTEQKDGFSFETGPSTGVMGSPELAELIADLKCQVNIANEEAKFRWIWKGEGWKVIPNGLIGGITTPLFSFSDKIRLLGEPFRKPGNNPNETLADMVKRRMGKSFLDYAVDPFVSGIYAGNPETLITKYALPKLYNLEQNYGSFIGGSIKKAREGKSEREKKATKDTFSFRGGLSDLIQALENELKEHIILNAQGISVSSNSEKYTLAYNDTEMSFDTVISTVGAWNLPSIFPFLPQNKVSNIANLRYGKVVQVSVGFAKWDGIDLKAFGGLVPSAEKRDILGVLFLSSFLENRAPGGGALLSVFLGGIRKEEFLNKSDDEIKTIVKEELCYMFKLKQWNPSLIEIRRHKHAIPQYGIDSEARIKTITELEFDFKGIILAGNIRDGISMSDRVKQAYCIAQEVINLSKE